MRTGRLLWILAALLATVVAAFGLEIGSGSDPLGVGSRLGLVTTPPANEATPDLAKEAAAAAAADEADGKNKKSGLIDAADGEALPPVTREMADARMDSREFDLMPNSAVEFGYRMDKGAALIYSWKSTVPIWSDFHTEPTANPKAVDSFEKGEVADSHGSYVAPYAGIHGWFWENTSERPVKLTLTATGFFTEAMLYDENAKAHPVPITAPRLDFKDRAHLKR